MARNDVGDGKAVPGKSVVNGFGGVDAHFRFSSLVNSCLIVKSLLAGQVEVSFNLISLDLVRINFT